MQFFIWWIMTDITGSRLHFGSRCDRWWKRCCGCARCVHQVCAAGGAPGRTCRTGISADYDRLQITACQTAQPVVYCESTKHCDLLAQLGEHLGDNQEVGSSSLPQITRYFAWHTHEKTPRNSQGVFFRRRSGDSGFGTGELFMWEYAYIMRY